MLKLSRKKVVLLFACMLLMFAFIGVNTQTTSNLAYIPGHFMSNFAYAYIPGGFMNNLAYITGGVMTDVVKIIPFIF